MRLLISFILVYKVHLAFLNKKIVINIYFHRILKTILKFKISKVYYYSLWKGNNPNASLNHMLYMHKWVHHVLRDVTSLHGFILTRKHTSFFMYGHHTCSGSDYVLHFHYPLQGCSIT